MEWEAIVVIFVLAIMLGTLFMEVFTPEVTFLMALLVVWNCGIITSDQALSGFANESMVAIGALFVVVRAVEKSGIVNRIARRVFGSNTTKSMGLLRMCTLAFALSSQLPNTPLVAVMLPLTGDWARSRAFAASQFLIPLSYSSIAGGMLTVIGSTTNLLVQGLLKQNGKEGFDYFSPAFIGLPCGIMLILYCCTVGQRLLPTGRNGMLTYVRDKTNELVTEMEVLDSCPLLGKPVQLLLHRLHLPVGSLIKIRRLRNPPNLHAAPTTESYTVYDALNTARFESLGVLKPLRGLFNNGPLHLQGLCASSNDHKEESCTPIRIPDSIYASGEFCFDDKRLLRVDVRYAERTLGAWFASNMSPQFPVSAPMSASRTELRRSRTLTPRHTDPQLLTQFQSNPGPGPLSLGHRPRSLSWDGNICGDVELCLNEQDANSGTNGGNKDDEIDALEKMSDVSRPSTLHETRATPTKSFGRPPRHPKTSTRTLNDELLVELLDHPANHMGSGDFEHKAHDCDDIDLEAGSHLHVPSSQSTVNPIIQTLQTPTRSSRPTLKVPRTTSTSFYGERTHRRGRPAKVSDVSTTSSDGEADVGTDDSASPLGDELEDDEVKYDDLCPVMPGERIQAGDILFVTRGVKALTKLQDKGLMCGLQILDSNVFELAGFGTDIVELVISDRNPFLGQSIVSSGFAAHYEVSIIALRSRGNEDVSQAELRSSGPLRPGDTVLCVCREQLWRTYTNNKDFYVCTCVGSLPQPVTRWDYFALVVFVVMLAVMATNMLTIVQASLTTMCVMVLGGWIKANEVMSLIDFRLLALIGCALGLAQSIQTSLLAKTIADLLLSANLGPQGALCLVFLLASMTTELVTNNAAAAITLPLALQIADAMNVSYKPFAMAVMVGCSTAFATPIGYQTNTMVWGPGGYKFGDFVKVGLPLNFMYLCVSSVLIPHFWAF